MPNVFTNLKLNTAKPIQCRCVPLQKMWSLKTRNKQIKTGYLFEHEAVSKVKVDVVKAAIVLPELVNSLVVVLVEVGEM